MPDDQRPLAELIPDRKLRNAAHYLFAQRLLPRKVHQIPMRFLYPLFMDWPGEPLLDPDRFIQSEWAAAFRPKSRPGSPVVPEALAGAQRPSDLRMSLHVVEDKPVALVRMPPPENLAEAFFAAAVLMQDVKDLESGRPVGTARYFTLELTIGEPGRNAVLCEWTREGEHWNSGEHLAPVPEEFLQAVGKRLQQSQPANPPRFPENPPR